MFRSAGRADSAHGFIILCAQYCNLLARCVHALALFCPTFNAIGETRFKCEHSLCTRAAYIRAHARQVLCESKGNPRASREIRACALY